MIRELATQRDELVAQSRAQREAIIAAAVPLLQKAAAVDRIYSRIRRHPVTVAAIGIGVVVLGARKLFNVATRVMAIYALFRK